MYRSGLLYSLTNVASCYTWGSVSRHHE